MPIIAYAIMGISIETEVTDTPAIPVVKSVCATNTIHAKGATAMLARATAKTGATIAMSAIINDANIAIGTAGSTRMLAGIETNETKPVR